MTDSVWAVLTEAHQRSRSRSPPPSDDEHRPASTSSTARRRPRSTPPSPPSGCSVLNEELLTVPDGFTVHPKLARQLDRRRDALRPPSRGRRLGPRRGARVRVAADRGDADPAHRPGRRARHLQPAPPGPARRRRPAAALRRSSTCRARIAPLELHNSPLSEMACLGFEYGYSPGGPRDAGPVGGAVRRLRQRRPGDHRPVHRLRPGQVGPDVPPDAAAAPRLRGLRARALLGAPGALPAARRRGQHPRRQPARRPPSTSTCCAARRGSPSSGRSSS